MTKEELQDALKRDFPKTTEYFKTEAGNQGMWDCSIYDALTEIAARTKQNYEKIDEFFVTEFRKLKEDIEPIAKRKNEEYDRDIYYAMLSFIGGLAKKESSLIRNIKDLEDATYFVHQITKMTKTGKCFVLDITTGDLVKSRTTHSILISAIYLTIRKEDGTLYDYRALIDAIRKSFNEGINETNINWGNVNHTLYKIENRYITIEEFKEILKNAQMQGVPKKGLIQDALKREFPKTTEYLKKEFKSQTVPPGIYSALKDITARTKQNYEKIDELFVGEFQKLKKNIEPITKRKNEEYDPKIYYSMLFFIWHPRFGQDDAIDDTIRDINDLKGALYFAHQIIKIIKTGGYFLFDCIRGRYFKWPGRCDDLVFDIYHQIRKEDGTLYDYETLINAIRDSFNGINETKIDWQNVETSLRREKKSHPYITIEKFKEILKNDQVQDALEREFPMTTEYLKAEAGTQWLHNEIYNALTKIAARTNQSYKAIDEFFVTEFQKLKENIEPIAKRKNEEYDSDIYYDMLFFIEALSDEQEAIIRDIEGLKGVIYFAHQIIKIIKTGKCFDVYAEADKPISMPCAMLMLDIYLKIRKEDGTLYDYETLVNAIRDSFNDDINETKINWPKVYSVVLNKNIADHYITIEEFKEILKNNQEK